jgi:hypothetical protein
MKTITMKSIQRSLDKVREPIEKRIAALDAEKSELEAMLARIGGGNGVKSSGTRGKNRTAEQLAEEAKQAIDFIRKHPGAKGSEIRKAVPGVGQNVRGFIEQYSDTKLKTTGKKAAMKYSV